MTVDRTPPPPPISSDGYPGRDDINFAPVHTGSKLGLPLDIKFTSSACTDITMRNEPLLLGTATPPSTNSPSILSVEPLSTPKFVTLTGQKTVKVNAGAYACELSHPLTKQYFFRFFLDFPESATRNDVTLPAERIYFMSSCWTSEDNIIPRARKWKDDLISTLQSLNTQIRELETGLMAKTRNFPTYIELLKRRKKLNLQLEMLEDGFPLDRPLIDGPNDTVMLREGVIAVKRLYGGGKKGGGGGMKTRYHWIGTFTFKDFVVDGKEEEEEEK